MPLRDDVEAVLRAWDAHETGRGAASIIDYDCYPGGDPVPAAPDRLQVLQRLAELHRRAMADGDQHIVARLRADLAYLRALLGERAPLDAYVRDTQGCPATGWSEDTLTRRRDQAIAALAGLGIGWGPNVDAELRELEQPLSAEDAADAIRDAATQLEPRVRALVGSSAPYTLTIETADVDAYWAYWLDGAGPNARLRFNLRHARFTQVRARQFALHEVLGHALEFASFAHTASNEDVPWVRIMSVHAPHQVLMEGLAQALPLLITPDEPMLVARVRLAHYVQLVHARLHLAINAGTSIEECAADARALVPYWDDDEIADALADRGANPLLRSYLWAYPAGLDWFVALADAADHDTIRELTHAAYRQPLTPTDLAHLWPAGPAFGGN